MAHDKTLVLRLYVTRNAPNSVRAIANLGQRYELRQAQAAKRRVGPQYSAEQRDDPLQRFRQSRQGIGPRSDVTDLNHRSSPRK